MGEGGGRVRGMDKRGRGRGMGGGWGKERRKDDLCHM